MSHQNTGPTPKVLRNNKNKNLQFIPANYSLKIIRNPKHVRASGISRQFAGRRVIDPSPVVQVCLLNSNGKDIIERAVCQLFIYVTLECVPELNEETIQKKKSITFDQQIKSDSESLYGEVITAPAIIEAENNDKKVPFKGFFIFQDLRVRYEGNYKLIFSLYEYQHNKQIALKCQIKSEIFRSYTAKDFPGLLPSTELDQILKSLGSRIRIRKTTGTKRGLVGSRRKNSNENILKKSDENSEEEEEEEDDEVGDYDTSTIPSKIRHPSKLLKTSFSRSFRDSPSRNLTNLPQIGPRKSTISKNNSSYSSPFTERATSPYTTLKTPGESFNNTYINQRLPLPNNFDNVRDPLPKPMPLLPLTSENFSSSFDSFPPLRSPFTLPSLSHKPFPSTNSSSSLPPSSPSPFSSVSPLQSKSLPPLATLPSFIDIIASSANSNANYNSRGNSYLLPPLASTGTYFQPFPQIRGEFDANKDKKNTETS